MVLPPRFNFSLLGQVWQLVDTLGTCLPRASRAFIVTDDWACWAEGEGDVDWGRESRSVRTDDARVREGLDFSGGRGDNGRLGGFLVSFGGVRWG
jgi:hypothetical protein